MQSAQHDEQILDQFTRQAEPFAARHGYKPEPILDLMAECAAVSEPDSVLDVACGPGIVSCFFAKRTGHVTGLDFVPAMLERARKFQSEQQVANVDWQQGSCTALPFPANSFDCVVTRFSFHHFLDPLAALSEMKRVCKPTGTVLVCDVAPRSDAQSAFNHWEILRDPSHTRALTQTEFESLGKNAGLVLRRVETTTHERPLEELLAGSFPKPGDTDHIRALFDAEIQAGSDTLGVAARRQDGVIRITYPVVVLAWRKPD